MTLLGKFVNSVHAKDMDFLPTMPPSYRKHYKLKNAKDKTSTEMDFFSKHYKIFNNTIFDSAGIGQYLGGTNEEFKPKGSNSTIGFINSDSVMDVSVFTYEWRRDAAERLVLFAVFEPPGATGGDSIDEIRVNNIHVHCKHTDEFYSLRKLKTCNSFIKSDYFSPEQKKILLKLHNLECYS